MFDWEDTSRQRILAHGGRLTRPARHRPLHVRASAAEQLPVIACVRPTPLQPEQVSALQDVMATPEVVANAFQFDTKCSKFGLGSAPLDRNRFVLIYHLPFGDRVETLAVFGVEMFLTLSGFLVATMIFERLAASRRRLQLQSFLDQSLDPDTAALLSRTGCDHADDGSGSAASPQPDVGPFLSFLCRISRKVARALRWLVWRVMVTGAGGVVLCAFAGDAVAGARSLCRAHNRYSIHCLAIVSLGGRGVAVSDGSQFDFDDMLRRTVVFRLDTFCWGMLMYLALQRWQASVCAGALPCSAPASRLMVLSMVAAAQPSLWRGVPGDRVCCRQCRWARRC